MPETVLDLRRLYAMHEEPVRNVPSNQPKFDFLWLELTNRCNLQCSHCYSGSSPYSGDRDFLTEADYLRLIEESYALGCRQIQFIGGEPTLNKSLPVLIESASKIGYEFVEVFTNLVKVSDVLIDTFKKYRVSIATSFYSTNALTHDGITGSVGSFSRTTVNMRKILAAGLDLRVGLIEMEANSGEYQSVFNYLTEMGVMNIGYDRIRGFGRAQENDTCSMTELCGHCAEGVLAIGPDGVVAPCIMSKQWPVGSVLFSNLTEIACSETLRATRQRIAEATSSTDAFCQPECGPNNKQCIPECGPSRQCPPCGPNAGHKCPPNGNCTPGR
jgi:MoaA/NifB/PqqE/SkfB family radical SAM enzyme